MSALALLRDYGISKKVARYAGLFTVESAEQDAHADLETRPALVIPYFDIHGDPVNASTSSVYYPRVKGLNWAAVAADPTASTVFVNDELRALALCAAGTPAIAVIGVPKERLAESLREFGANVITRGAMH